MLNITESKFLKSIIDLKQKPSPGLPEFAFAGRSNVGKSSLINCLVNRKNFAKVSKQPGKTRTINYYLINSLFYFVDLPGYGYAKVPESEKAKWAVFIENYLLKSEHLNLLFVLVDSVVGLQKNDMQLLEWIKFNRIPFQLVATKADRINKNQRTLREREIKKHLKLNDESPIYFFSSKTRSGREALLDRIEISI